MADLADGSSDDDPGFRDASHETFSPVWWVLIGGNRLAVTGVFLVATFLLLLAITASLGSIAQDQTSPLFYLYSALVGGNFTLVTIVISVSQLVISRQLGTPGQIRDQIRETNEFRDAIEEASDVDVAPVTPTEFLHFLLRSTAKYTRDLTEEAEGETGEAWDELRTSIDQLAGHIGRVDVNLTHSDVAVVSTLAVTLDTNYSADIYDFRVIRSEYGDVYTDTVHDYLDSLIARLQQIDVGRQYLKTLYIQDELSALSRTLFYVGIPALLSAVLMLRVFAVGFERLTSGFLSVVVPLTVTISLAPLLILFAYVLRITTVARRTLAVTPFTMGTQERERDLLELD